MTPQFNSVADFFAMGGDAPFVFGAWGLSVAVIAGLIIRTTLAGRAQKARLQTLEADLEK
jgi:heme exporter protein D